MLLKVGLGQMQEADLSKLFISPQPGQTPTIHQVHYIVVVLVPDSATKQLTEWDFQSTRLLLTVCPTNL